MRALMFFCVLSFILFIGIELRGNASFVAKKIGPSCGKHSITETNDEPLCLGLKVVAYQDSDNFPVIDEQEVVQDLIGVNQVWGQCGMTFEIDEYLTVDEEKKHLRFHPANQSEMNAIRRAYDDSKSFLIVTTGTWNRNGSLGRTSANAWTNMPGEDIYGAIIESKVGTFPNLIAHELGHYLNLDHEDNPDDVMNPIISEDSTRLTSKQCSVARTSVKEYWMRMLRKSEG